MSQKSLKVFLISLVLAQSLISVRSTIFTIENKCDYTVWPGILSNAGVPTLDTTGFSLQQGETRIITAPTSWGGRFWGRTHCAVDSTTGKFSCATGDCGSDKLECDGNGAAPPATLAEFTLDGGGGLDFFDVSLVDGYNLPMLVEPSGGTGQQCTSTGCVEDLNNACPSELRVTSSDGGESIACKSACEAFGRPEFCCSGEYGTPDTCKPSSFSQGFKLACPRAYSYAYDDKTSTFTCANADYTITFCPSLNPSQKTTQDPIMTSATTATETSGSLPQDNSNTMVYEGVSELSTSKCPHMSGPRFMELMFSFSFTLGLWLLGQM